MSKTLLLDGDITAYQFAATGEKAIDWGNGLWTLHCDADYTSAQMDGYLVGLMEDLGCDKMIIALSDSENFRFDVLPTYKHNRKGTRKPVCLKQMREHMLLHYKTFLRPGLEGDDILGILMTSEKLVPGAKVMFSIDKDMLTIPGEIVSTKDRVTRNVTIGQANFMHLFQTLTGDTTDGYKGLPGCGPKAALTLLGADKKLDFRTDDLPSIATCDVINVWHGVIVPAYAKQKLGEEHALTQARVARILRATDYDFKRKEPILWTPAH